MPTEALSSVGFVLPDYSIKPIKPAVSSIFDILRLRLLQKAKTYAYHVNASCLDDEVKSLKVLVSYVQAVCLI